MTLAERIKALRKERGMTQEQLADYLHISPQAISKWETAQSSPDVDMIPKLAIIFDTSLDELFDFDRSRLEGEVEELVKESVPLRQEPEKAEAFYREALRRYPGNEVLLNCLLMVIGEEQAEERIEIGERLIEATRDDTIRLDALRLLAQTYHRLGEKAMAEHYLSQIPELYFLKTEIAAFILGGKEQQNAIETTEKTCFGILLAMCLLSREGKVGPSERDCDKLAEHLTGAYALLFGEDAAKGLREKYQNKSLLETYH